MVIMKQTKKRKKNDPDYFGHSPQIYLLNSNSDQQWTTAPAFSLVYSMNDSFVDDVVVVVFYTMILSYTSYKISCQKEKIIIFSLISL